MVYRQACQYNIMAAAYLQNARSAAPPYLFRYNVSRNARAAASSRAEAGDGIMCARWTSIGA